MPILLSDLEETKKITKKSLELLLLSQVAELTMFTHHESKIENFQCKIITIHCYYSEGNHFASWCKGYAWLVSTDFKKK